MELIGKGVLVPRSLLDTYWSAYFLYKRAPALLGFDDFCRAGDAHIAARCAPVAPHGEIQTLGEHGLLCRRFGQHARHGAPFCVF